MPLIIAAMVSSPAPRVAVTEGNAHRLLRVYDKGRCEFQAVSGGDALETASLRIEHAVGVTPHSVVQRDVILMFANTLLAAVPSELTITRIPVIYSSLGPGK